MDFERMQRLLDGLGEIDNSDDLLDFELLNGPFDEDDPHAARVLFQIAAVRCQLARGPAPSAETFALTLPAPKRSRHRFEVRGRIGTRIVRVGWADGMLFGSLYAIARLHLDATTLAHAVVAREIINEQFDVVLDEMPAQAVA